MYEVQSRVVPETPTLVVRGKVAVTDMADFLGPAFEATAAHAVKTGVPMVGPPFGIYQPIGTEMGEFDAEVGFPVAKPVEGEGDVVASTLPAAPVAATWRIGPYARVGEAYEALGEWIEANGSVADGPGWEVYYSDPGTTDPSDYRTEVIQPYRTE